MKLADKSAIDNWILSSNPQSSTVEVTLSLHIYLIGCIISCHLSVPMGHIHLYALFDITVTYRSHPHLSRSFVAASLHATVQ